jgi:hypothetical protein
MLSQLIPTTISSLIYMLIPICTQCWYANREFPYAIFWDSIPVYIWGLPICIQGFTVCMASHNCWNESQVRELPGGLQILPYAYINAIIICRPLFSFPIIVHRPILRAIVVCCHHYPPPLSSATAIVVHCRSPFLLPLLSAALVIRRHHCSPPLPSSAAVVICCHCCLPPLLSAVVVVIHSRCRHPPLSSFAAVVICRHCCHPPLPSLSAASAIIATLLSLPSLATCAHPSPCCLAGSSSATLFNCCCCCFPPLPSLTAAAINATLPSWHCPLLLLSTTVVVCHQDIDCCFNRQQKSC